MEDMSRRIFLIQACAACIPFTSDTIELDRALGELDCLVHEARLAIDDEWRELRRAAFPPTRSPSFEEDLA